MAMRPPVIVEAAINGNTPKATNPHVPRTPSEITACALECLDRGAAIVHNHNDEPNIGGPATHDHGAIRGGVGAGPGDASGRSPAPHGAWHDRRRADRGPLRASRCPVRDGIAPDGLGRPGIVSIGPMLYGNSVADTDYMFDWCR